MKLTVKELSQYINLGVVTGVWFQRNPMADNWLIVIGMTDGHGHTLETARGEVREFGSLDTAVRVLESVGVKTTSFKLEGF